MAPSLAILWSSLALTTKSVATSPSMTTTFVRVQRPSVFSSLQPATMLMLAFLQLLLSPLLTMTVCYLQSNQQNAGSFLWIISNCNELFEVLVRGLHKESKCYIQYWASYLLCACILDLRLLQNSHCSILWCMPELSCIQTVNIGVAVIEMNRRPHFEASQCFWL